MKKLSLTILGLCIGLAGFAQSLSPQVISSSGSFASGGGYTLSQTIGEMTMVQTFAGSGSVILTQGFQQPERNNVGILDFTENGGLLDVFPNPAVDFFRIKYEFSQSGELNIAIFNPIGQKISSDYIDDYNAGSKSLLIQTSDLAAGVYYIKSTFTAKDGSQYLMTKKLEVIR